MIIIKSVNKYSRHIMIFAYKGFSVQVSPLSTSEALFLASDVAACLGLHVKTVSRFLKDNLRVKDYRTVSSGQGRPAYYVTEAGIYDMALHASTETARDFRYWIIDEVLPAIRRDGAYVAPDITQPQAIAVKEKLDRILLNFRTNAIL
jgi:anti-repressor protein